MSEVEQDAAAVAPKREDSRENIFFFIGLAFLIAGIFWIYRPAALIVLGVLLIAYAWTLSQKPESPRVEE